MGYTMSVGRDYRTNSQYEYVIFSDDEKVAAREGFFRTSTQAKRAGLKAAQALIAADEAAEPSLPFAG